MQAQSRDTLAEDGLPFLLAVLSDLAHKRLAATVAAGGRLLDESEDRWRVADPEGNEMVIVSGA